MSPEGIETRLCVCDSVTVGQKMPACLSINWTKFSSKANVGYSGPKVQNWNQLEK